MLPWLIYFYYYYPLFNQICKNLFLFSVHGLYSGVHGLYSGVLYSSEIKVLRIYYAEEKEIIIPWSEPIKRF